MELADVPALAAVVARSLDDDCDGVGASDAEVREELPASVALAADAATTPPAAAATAAPPATRRTDVERCDDAGSAPECGAAVAPPFQPPR